VVRAGDQRVATSAGGFDKGTGGVAFCTDGRRVFFTISSDDWDVWTTCLTLRERHRATGGGASADRRLNNAA